MVLASQLEWGEEKINTWDGDYWAWYKFWVTTGATWEETNESKYTKLWSIFQQVSTFEKSPGTT